MSAHPDNDVFYGRNDVSIRHSIWGYVLPITPDRGRTQLAEQSYGGCPILRYGGNQGLELVVRLYRSCPLTHQTLLKRRGERWQVNHIARHGTGRVVIAPWCRVWD